MNKLKFIKLCTIISCLFMGACASTDHSVKRRHADDVETSKNVTFNKSYTPSPESYSPGHKQNNPKDQARYMIDCRGKRIDLARPVEKITAYFESRKIMYNSIQLSDCSGIFHRVLGLFDQVCPGYQHPSPTRYRSTRELARWYHEQGKLVLVYDAVKNMDLIKPGAVLFYGKQNKRYRNFTHRELFNSVTGINHMGVVVSVERDRNNRVISYQLFHGRKPGSVAKTTTHSLKTSRSSYPAYGNGSQQWVAFARLVGTMPN